MTTLTLDRPDLRPAPVRATAERYGLTADQLDELGRELDAIRERVTADLGQDDVDLHPPHHPLAARPRAAAGRASLFLGFLPPFWVGGTLALAVAKILDNMEIGHNVMHGQYDWTARPSARSRRRFEWDTVCPADQWRHSHNYLHHTFTNIHRQGPRRRVRRPADEPTSSRGTRVPRQPALRHRLALLLPVGRDAPRRRGRSHPWRARRRGREAWPTLRAGLAQDRDAGPQGLRAVPALTGPLFLSTLARQRRPPT